MAATALTQFIESAEDMKLLKKTLAQLSGRIRSIRFTYGDEVELEVEPSHLGSDEPRPWLLGTQGSHWSVLDAHGKELATSDTDPEQSEPLLKRLEGAQVDRLSAGYPDPDLIVTLEDGTRMVVQAKGGGKLHEPPFWEVFTPGNMVVSAGPGAFWSHYPADVPGSDRARMWEHPRIPGSRFLSRALSARLLFLPLPSQRSCSRYSMRATFGSGSL